MRAGLFSLCFSSLGATPIIAEFLASNRTSRVDEDGDSSDWIEIYNPDDDDIDLGGFTLGDDPTSSQSWSIPDGTTLHSEQRLLIFASGKNRSNSEELHTNFALAASGGSLFLRDSSGSIISQYEDYPAQRTDISYGIGSDTQTGFFLPPTPTEPNDIPAEGLVAETVFSAPRGFYENLIEVAISTATPTSSIHYTTDGSTPSPTHGTLYTGVLPISNTTVIRAIAFGENMIPSRVNARSYLFSADIIEQAEMSPDITQSVTYQDEVHDALKALPIVSLSFEEKTILGPDGIYENPTLKGRSSEREIHFEYFDPANPSDTVQEPAGLRIHGGNSRLHPKKPLRIYFRDDYGKPRLEHDLFPDSPVKSFKKLVLRGGGHDSWTFRNQWQQATLIRNQFHHLVQRDMGQPSPYGRPVNVFLNGQYWGIYELQELPHEHYNADHHGGEPADWDVVKHRQEVEAGDRIAWDALITLARSGIRSTADYQAIQEYLDLENFADAMIQRIWASDEDWLSPYFLDGTEIDSFSVDKNWYVARKSRNGTSKFYFYNWDAEMSMGIPFSAPQTADLDFSKINNDGSPGIIYDALRRFPEFQILFADRLQKHFFIDGALTALPLQKKWDKLQALVRTPIVAESARWGIRVWDGVDRDTPFTRDDEWTPAASWVRNQFIPNRSRKVLEHFGNVGLFSPLQAPFATPFGNIFPAPINVNLTSSSETGAIYYTTDGTDPRIPSRNLTLAIISEDSPVQALIPTATINSEIGVSWRDVIPPSNISTWVDGFNGVGFDRGSGGDYRNLIATDVEQMWDNNASAYLRYEFTIENTAALIDFETLLLKVQYDDGFAAYLNGALVASNNFDDDSWDGNATNPRSDTDAVIFRSFDVSAQIAQLKVGKNVLAIHGQNVATRNSDFLIRAILDAQTSIPAKISPTAFRYDRPIEVTTNVTVKARYFDGSRQWSPLTEKYYSIARPAATDRLIVSEIHYHPTAPAAPEEIAISQDQDDYEFLEFFNTSDQTIDLGGCTFDRGLTFTFPQGTTLPARQRGIVVSNRAAFIARYGTETRALILGEFERGSRLSNGGEPLSLQDANGQNIFALTYRDSLPWPASPDGQGPSLVLKNADTSSHGLASASRWRSSASTNGTPGFPEITSFPQWIRNRHGDDSGNGTHPDDIPQGESETNLILYAQARELAQRAFTSTNFMNEGDLRLATYTYQIRSSLFDVTVTPELSNDLINWQATIGPIFETKSPDGTTLITVRSAQPVISGAPLFFRLNAIYTP